MYNHLTLQMYDLTLTANEAMPATWGKPKKPRGINRGAVADPAAMIIRVLYFAKGNQPLPRVTLMLTPRLSPVG